MSNHKQPVSELRQNKKALLFMAVIISSAVTLVIWALISFGISLGQKRDLIHRGIQATGVVTRHTSQFEAIRGGGFDVYQISYKFNGKLAVRTRTISNNNVEVSRKEWQNLSVGSPINIAYMPNNLSENQPSFALRAISPDASRVISFITSFLLLFLAFSLLKYLPIQRKGILSLIILIVITVMSFVVGTQLGAVVSRRIATLLLR